MRIWGRKPKTGGAGDSRIPLGLWMKCPSPACGKATFGKTVEENFHVCPECGFHMKVSAALRVRHLIDEGTWEPFAEELQPKDVLRFVDTESYEAKIEKSARKTGMSEAALVGRGRLGGRNVTLCVLDFGYMGGSMGVVVGERFARAAEDALARKAAFIGIASSGGARMHEGALSLMQLAKTSAVVARLREARVPYVSVLADPCTGGVSASFAAQGDLTLAEPGALIGFAGPRVIESTIKTNLPEGFQRAEFLLEHGYIDRIVPRPKLKEELGSLLDFLVRTPAQGKTSVRAGTP
jgi:acetyl-CoA carboxylase carboxyl transferase subunit beta